MQLLCWYRLCLKASVQSNNASDLLLWEVTQSLGVRSPGGFLAIVLGLWVGICFHCESKALLAPQRHIFVVPRAGSVWLSELGCVPMSRCDSTNPFVPLCAQLIWSRGVLSCAQHHLHTWMRSKTALAVGIILHRGGDKLLTHRPGREQRLCQGKAGERSVFLHTQTRARLPPQ